MIPELYNGKNVADFIDPDIAEKLDALEREEEKLIEDGFYESDQEMETEREVTIKKAAMAIKAKKGLMVLKHRAGKNKKPLPKAVVARRSRLDEFESHLEKIGNKGAPSAMKSMSRKRSSSNMDVDRTSRGPSAARDRSVMGMKPNVPFSNVAKRSCDCHALQGAEKVESACQARRIGPRDQDQDAQAPVCRQAWYGQSQPSLIQASFLLINCKKLAANNDLCRSSFKCPTSKRIIRTAQSETLRRSRGMQTQI